MTTRPPQLTAGPRRPRNQTKPTIHSGLAIPRGSPPSRPPPLIFHHHHRRHRALKVHLSRFSSDPDRRRISLCRKRRAGWADFWKSLEHLPALKARIPAARCAICRIQHTHPSTPYPSGWSPLLSTASRCVSIAIRPPARPLASFRAGPPSSPSALDSPDPQSRRQPHHQPSIASARPCLAPAKADLLLPVSQHLRAGLNRHDDEGQPEANTVHRLNLLTVPARNSFGGRSRAMPPSTTPQNPSRSPSLVRTQSPSSRPKRYPALTHARRCTPRLA